VSFFGTFIEARGAAIPGSKHIAAGRRSTAVGAWAQPERITCLDKLTNAGCHSSGRGVSSVCIAHITIMRKPTTRDDWQM
jgi:hypothetical protein